MNRRRFIRSLADAFCYRVAAIDAPALQDRLAQLTSALPERFSPAGTKGYAFPALTKPKVVKPRWRPAPSWLRSNWLVLADGSDGRRICGRMKVDRGKKGNIVLAGPRSAIPASIHFQGNNGLVILGEHCTWFADLTIRLSSDDELLFWGARASSNGTSIVLSGEGMSVIVGEDCMFAADTVIRTSDLHSILSLEDGSWLNPPESVLLEPHVWVGQEAMLLKGSHVGTGSIIGAKALVNGPIPPVSAAAGLPAKVIKRGVSWDRAARPLGNELPESLVALASALPA